MTRALVERADVSPCLECGGEGSLYDESGRGVPYGRSNYVTCPRCKGSKLGTTQEARAAYRAIMADYSAKYVRHRQRLSARKRAKRILTKEEWDAVLHFGG